MPIDFPNSPAVNDTFTSGTRTWKWDGTVWSIVVPTGSVGPTGPTGPTGATGATGATGITITADDDQPIVAGQVFG